MLREETFEIKNEGTPDEEKIVFGQFSFKGDDGFKYFIKYRVDKEGSHVEIDSVYVHRIPPSTLKSLVG